MSRLAAEEALGPKSYHHRRSMTAASSRALDPQEKSGKGYKKTSEIPPEPKPTKEAAERIFQEHLKKGIPIDKTERKDKQGKTENSYQ